MARPSNKDVFPCCTVCIGKLVGGYAHDGPVFGMKLFEFSMQSPLVSCNDVGQAERCPEQWSRIATQWMKENVVESIEKDGLNRVRVG